MLKRLHSAHLGCDSMIRRARDKIFWIGIKSQIKQLARSCETCEQNRPRNQKQPMKQHSDGKHPWDKVGTDLFQIENKTYLLVIDYFTNYIELDLLTTTTSKQVIKKLKKQFSRFGIPRQIISDGGPQYSSAEFKEFAKSWQIQHHITSPNHPNSNGKAEAGVKIAKRMMLKCLETRSDPYEALLELRNTPRADTGLSPQEMMFSRQARTRIPTFEKTQVVNVKRQKRKKQIKKSYDRRAKPLPQIVKGDNVYFEHRNIHWKPGQVRDRLSERNYLVVGTDNTTYNRNRDHMRQTGVNVHIRDKSPAPIQADLGQPMNNNSEHIEAEVVPENHALQTNRYMNLRPRRNINPPAYLKDYIRH
ncbi:uncharacterized protein K02A2.6-like [Dreissena polymorpha]|uniref:uncharacterized protein K02A2.6-like n=1 Tax=Dreissena polymorpha TaxID=45954 RepID=UPI002263EF22|nr:uncharacterized protein K02A2.6-like [Dreissena polymorpha]